MNIRTVIRAGLAALVGFGLAMSAATDSAEAQTRADFMNAFAGEWRTLSGNFTGSNERCSIVLDAAEGSPLPVENRGCGRELAAVAAWEISSGQIVLLDGQGGEVARLGGNQRTLNGTIGERNAIVLRREGGPFAAADPGCIYLGYTSSCAGLDDLAAPRIDEATSVNVLTKANLRASASSSADVLDIVPANTCVAVDRCTAGSDGAWCRGRFAGRDGWIKKQSVRLDQYPTIVFANGC